MAALLRWEPAALGAEAIPLGFCRAGAAALWARNLMRRRTLGAWQMVRTSDFELDPKVLEPCSGERFSGADSTCRTAECYRIRPLPAKLERTSAKLGRD